MFVLVDSDEKDDANSASDEEKKSIANDDDSDDCEFKPDDFDGEFNIDDVQVTKEKKEKKKKKTKVQKNRIVFKFSPKFSIDSKESNMFVTIDVVNKSEDQVLYIHGDYLCEYIKTLSTGVTLTNMKQVFSNGYYFDVCDEDGDPVNSESKEGTLFPVRRCVMLLKDIDNTWFKSCRWFTGYLNNCIAPREEHADRYLKYYKDAVIDCMDNDVLSDKFEGIINSRFHNDFQKKDSEYGLTTVKAENTACLKSCVKGNKPDVVRHFFPQSNPAKVMGVLKAKGVV